MSFWELDDGEDATDTGKEFDGGGGNFENIPDNTNVLACPDEAKWDKFNEAEYVSIRWSVLKPETYANRKVFQKLWVADDDPQAKDPSKKRDKAKRMFAAIDANAGGKLAKSGKMPTNDSMTTALVNKPMVIKLMVWELTDDQGQERSGNWVAAVSPKSHEISKGDEPAPAPKKKAATKQPVDGNGDDDEIPF